MMPKISDELSELHGKHFVNTTMIYDQLRFPKIRYACVRSATNQFLFLQKKSPVMTFLPKFCVIALQFGQAIFSSANPNSLKTRN